jgi:hypothetical protein
MDPEIVIAMGTVALCVLLGCVVHVTKAIIAVCESIVKVNEAQVAAMEWQEVEVFESEDGGEDEGEDEEEEWKKV